MQVLSFLDDKHDDEDDDNDDDMIDDYCWVARLLHNVNIYITGSVLNTNISWLIA